MTTNNFLWKKNLIFKNEIWSSNTSSFISYPEDGNNECYKIEDQSFWFAHRSRIIKEIFIRFSISGNFFDIGGGNGFVLTSLNSIEQLEGILVEPGGAGIKNAQLRGVKNLVWASFSDCRFESQSLDNVGLFDVLEHIKSDSVFLKELNSALKIDGFLVLTVPAFSFLWSRNDVEAGHFRRYSMGELTSLLKSCDYQIEYKSYFFSFLLIPLFFLVTLLEVS